MNIFQCLILEIIVNNIVIIQNCEIKISTWIKKGKKGSFFHVSNNLFKKNWNTSNKFRAFAFTVWVDTGAPHADTDGECAGTDADTGVIGAAEASAVGATVAAGEYGGGDGGDSVGVYCFQNKENYFF